jgi:hypothetical protein
MKNSGLVVNETNESSVSFADGEIFVLCQFYGSFKCTGNSYHMFFFFLIVRLCEYNLQCFFSSFHMLVT